MKYIFIVLTILLICSITVKGAVNVLESSASSSVWSNIGDVINSCKFDLNLRVELFPIKNVTTNNLNGIFFYYDDCIHVSASATANFNQSPQITFYDQNDVPSTIVFSQYVCTTPLFSLTFVPSFKPKLMLHYDKLPDNNIDVGIISTSTNEYSMERPATQPYSIGYNGLYLFGEASRSKVLYFNFQYPGNVGTSTLGFTIKSGSQTGTLNFDTSIKSSTVPTLVSFKDHNHTNSYMLNLSLETNQPQPIYFAFKKIGAAGFSRNYLQPVYGTPHNATVLGFKFFSFTSSLSSMVIQDIAFFSTVTTKLYSFLYNTPPIPRGSSSNLYGVYNNTLNTISFSSYISGPFDYYKVADQLFSYPFKNYPYGFTNGNFKNYTFTKSFFAPKYFQTSSITIRTDTQKIISFNPLIDSTDPLVNKIDYIKLINGQVLVRVNVTCGPSGLKSFIIRESDPILPIDTVYSNSQYTIYEKIILTPNANAIQFYLSNFYKTVFSSYSPIGFLPDIGRIKFSDMTELYFEKNNVDLSNNGVLNTLYLNSTNADINFRIPFKLVSTSEIATNILTQTIAWDYLSWDYILQKYKVQFYMPARMFTGVVNYILYIDGRDMDSPALSSIFPTSILNVISSNADEMAPIVSQIVPKMYPEGSNMTLSWIITISDPLNGLESGNLTINSDLDYLGYQFTFGPCDSIDPYEGVYQFNITIDLSICKSQTFSIKELTLRDTSGHFSNSSKFQIDYNYYILDPFINIPDLSIYNIDLICNNSVEINNDINGPEIYNFKTSVDSIDVTSNNRTMDVYFETYDENELSLRHNPYIYIEDIFTIQPIGFRATRVKGYNSTWISYRTTIQIPYNFGISDKRFGISVYGAADKLMNIKGYSFDELKNQSYNSIINVKTDAKDVIITNIELVNMVFSDKTQEYLFIYGHGFGLDSSLVQIKLYDQQNTLLRMYPSSEFNKFSSILIQVAKVFTLTTFTIKVEKTDNGIVKSATYQYSPPSTFKPVYCTGYPADIEVDPIPNETLPPVTNTPIETNTPVINIPCSNDCGSSKGYGYCNNGTCACTYPQSGLDCLSTIVKTNITNNPRDPSVTMNDQTKFESILSVVELRELDSNSNEISGYKLISDQWILINSISNDIYKENQYRYMLPSTNITSVVQVFKQAYNVTFGNQVINMQPSTVKFTFEITSYPFSSSLNALQLVLMATFKSLDSPDDNSICSISNFIKDQGTSEYLKIQIQDKSLFGRFIKYGIVGGRETLISNTLLKDYTGSIIKPDETQTYIGLNIPYYTTSIQLDPDFSVLIESTSASDQENSICSDKKNKLTGAQIAGIVIGGVVFIVIVGIASIFIFSRKAHSSIAVKLKKVITK